MTTYQQLAELRRWWRDRKSPSSIDLIICGYVYSDPDQFWNDGDFGEFEVVTLVDAGPFYIMHTKGKTIFKLDKDDEGKKS